MIIFNIFFKSSTRFLLENTLAIPFEGLSRENFGIIYLTEDIAQAIPDTVAFYDQQLTPALILIPTHRGTTGLGQQRIRDNVEKAVGQDIL